MVKVLDFGIAKLAGAQQTDITKTGDVIGTPGFMSPEQLRGRDIGPATDLYNLGVILWELIEGRPMFTADTAFALCMRHLTEPTPPLTRPVPAHVEQLVFQLLRKDPTRRGSANAALAALQPAAHRHPEQHGEPQVRRWHILLLVGLLIALAFVAWRILNPPVTTSMPVRMVAKPPETTPAPTETHEIVDGGPRLDTPSPALRPIGCGIAWRPGTVRADASAVFKHTYTRPPDRVAGSLIHVPRGYDPDQLTPMIIVLHDGKQTPSGAMDEVSRLLSIADQERVLVLFVEGAKVNDLAALAGEASISSFPWRGHVTNIDPLIELLIEAFCIDRDRVFLLGLRRGSRGAEDLLATSGRFAAVAMTDHSREAHDGFLLRDRPAIPTLWLTSKESPTRPLNGRRSECVKSSALVPFDTREREMRAHHKCATQARTVKTSNGATCRTWSCGVPFISCMVEGGGRWPGYPGGGPCEGPASTYDYGGEIWKFFERVSEEP